MSIVLKVTFSDNVQEYKLKNNKMTIGRSPKADICIRDSGISSMHGQFSLDENSKLLYKDLGSKNGSYLNGLGVLATHIMIDDTLKIGDVKVTIDVKLLKKAEALSLGRRGKTRYVERRSDVTLTVDKNKH